MVWIGIYPRPFLHPMEAATAHLLEHMQTQKTMLAQPCEGVPYDGVCGGRVMRLMTRGGLNAVTMLPLFLTFLLGALVCLVLLSLSRFVGPRRPTPVKVMPFECGMEQMEQPRSQLSIKFSVVAMLFIIFDIEVAFLYPWAVRVSSAWAHRARGHPGVPAGADGGLPLCLAAWGPGVGLSCVQMRREFDE